ncbi:MAG: DoxX family protein [Bacteroidales bacterium]|nr:DoxX family protein [Bacteroidales bacterium]
MNKQFKTVLNYVLRILFGGVFIFSGTVKAIDPMGTAFKIEEYLSVFGFDWLTAMIPSVHIILSVLLCCAEFLIGVTVLLHIYNKVNKWAAAAFMLFFTVTTLIDALTNNVSDCGCFGDAVKLTNWQTFFKNIILDVILVGIFITDENKPQQFKNPKNWLALLVFAIFILVFCIRNIMYEPMVDFRPWKIGNKMAPKESEQAPAVTFATYKNNQTGEEKEFSMDDLMEFSQKDTNFQQHWTFIASRYINPNEIKADGFSLTAFESNEDESLALLSDTTSSLYILAVVDINKVSDKGMKKALKFLKDKFEKGERVIIITASLPDLWYNFQEKYNLSDYMIYSCDDKAILAMARNNPSIVQIKDTKVVNKWGWRSIPK